MFQSATDLISTHRLGDWASLIGLLVTFIGFTLTLRNVARSKRAAEQAERAVEQLRKLLAQASVISDFSAAVVIMDEIKRLHRVHAWAVLPDRYSALKRLLITIRTAHPTISEGHRVTIQGAILHFTGMERKIEQVIANKATEPNVPRLNKIMSTQIDALSEALAEIRDQIGR